MKAVLLVPAFNESAVIFDVLKSLPKKINGISKFEILVIDDGSTDNTAQIVQRAKVNYIAHVINRGLGAAIKTGLTWARRNDFDIAITFDADGQHDSREIQKIASPIINAKADLVIGSRFKERQKAPFDRIVINWFANLATLLLFNVFTTDSQSGFRAFSKKAIRKIDFRADRMEFSSEILSEAKRNKLKIIEVPISAIYTPYSREKGQKNLNSISVFMKLLVKFLR